MTMKLEQGTHGATDQRRNLYQGSQTSPVAVCDSPEHAREIARTFNARGELLFALRRLVDSAGDVYAAAEKFNSTDQTVVCVGDGIALDNARAAIAAATN